MQVRAQASSRKLPPPDSEPFARWICFFQNPRCFANSIFRNPSAFLCFCSFLSSLRPLCFFPFVIAKKSIFFELASRSRFDHPKEALASEQLHKPRKLCQIRLDSSVRPPRKVKGHRTDSGLRTLEAFLCKIQPRSFQCRGAVKKASVLVAGASKGHFSRQQPFQELAAKSSQESALVCSSRDKALQN